MKLIVRFRWFRFSLKTLLLAVTIMCVWLGAKVHDARRQRRAVEILEKAGAHIWFDYQEIPDGFTTNSAPPGPVWLREFLGDEFFRDVVSVDIANASISHDDFEEIGDLPGLKGLMLWNLTIGNAGNSVRPINDEDLRVLDSLHNLTDVIIEDARIEGTGLRYLLNSRRIKNLQIGSDNLGDVGLEQIARMNRLERLCISSPRVTDAGIRSLARMSSLMDLDLSHVHLSDKAMETVGALTNLRVLDADSSFVTDAGLRHVAGLANLGRLSLSGTKISDDGLNYLKDLTNLVDLNLCMTSITDAGLSHLARMAKLKHLEVGVTGVTREAAQRFQRQTPGVEVTGGWPE